MTFKRPGEDDDDDEVGPVPAGSSTVGAGEPVTAEAVPVAELPPIVIHDDD